MECRKCHFIILFTPGDYSEFHINPTEADQESEVKWFTVNLLRHGFDQDLNATLTPTTTINQSEQRSLESGCCLAGVMTPCRDYPYSGCSPAKSLGCCRARRGNGSPKNSTANRLISLKWNANRIWIEWAQSEICIPDLTKVQSINGGVTMDAWIAQFKKIVHGLMEFAADLVS